MLSWRHLRWTTTLALTALLAGSVALQHDPDRSEDASTAPPVAVHERGIPSVAPVPTPSVSDSPTTVDAKPALVAELEPTVVKPFSMLGVTWKSGLPNDAVIEAKWRTGGKWTAWSEIELDLENTATEGGRPGTEPQWVGESDGVAVRVISPTRQAPRDLQLATIDPGHMTALTPVAFRTGAAAPDITLRSAWGADNSGKCDSPLYGSTTRGAVVHHTAGSNSYSASDSANIVRATQAYHMQGRDWCDIGYNFLVDKYGQVFEGRKGGIDKPVRAAHSGNGSVNQETMGVSMMGTFSSTEPTNAMKSSVVSLIAWRFNQVGIAAKGTFSLGGVTLNRISGHRNVVSTECPGAAAYAWISASGGLRDRVESELADAGEPIPSSVEGLAVSNVSSTGATVSWDEVPTAVKYRVYVSPSSSMPGSCEPYCSVITPSDLSAPSHVLSGLKSGGTYYVKVSAINGAGKTITGWQSSPLKVQLSAGSIPSSVEGLAVSNVSSTGATVSWDEVPTAVKYRVYVSPSSSMPGSCEPYCSVITPSDLSAPSHVLSGLKSGGTYYVKVSAINGAGKTITGWQSSPLKVQLSAGSIPSSVEGLAVSNVSSTGATVSWDEVPTAVKYRVYVSPSSSMPGSCEPYCSVITPSDLSAPSHVLSGLKSGGTYYVKVSAINGAGKTITGWQSSPLKVQLSAGSIPSSVEGLAVSNVSSTGATVSWDEVPTAVKYRVYVSPSSSMPGSCEPYCSVITPSDLSAPSHVLSGLKSGGTYYVKVSAINGAGKTITGWQSSPLKVQLSAGSIPSSVEGLAVSNVSSTGATVSWDEVPTAVKYRVYVSPSSSMPGSCEPYCSVITPSDLSAPSHVLSGLKSGGTYYVKVSAINGAGKTITGWQSSPLKVQLSAGSTVGSSTTVPSSRKVVFKGGGYGHGIGMSQYGAEGAARLGKTYSQILAKYYPGTTMSTYNGSIRVLLSGQTWDSTTITARSGLSFRQPVGGSVIQLPTTVSGSSVQRWTIEPLGSDKKQSTLRYRTASGWQTYRTFTGDAQFESSSPMELHTASGARTYRSALRSSVPSSGSTVRDTVNVLDVEDYTRGVVAREMPSSWHEEALKAQSVAARTYGVRSIKSGGRYDICDTTSCQVYGGVAAETAATDRTVSATDGRILTYGGSPAFTQFSSSSGGYTAKGSMPYLVAQPDDWDDWSGNAKHSWNITVSASTIEGKYPAIGTLKSLTVVARTPGDGRVTSLKLVGSKGSTTIAGTDARFKFGLLSHMFGF